MLNHIQFKYRYYFRLFINCSNCILTQREGALDDDSADMDGENGRGFEEYEWAGQKRIDLRYPLFIMKNVPHVSLLIYCKI